jgi:hypothetical protein
MSVANGRTPKQKNHAQDGGTLIGDQRPAILPWFLSFGCRASLIASHGHLARYAQSPDCFWTLTLSMIVLENCFYASASKSCSLRRIDFKGR